MDKPLSLQLNDTRLALIEVLNKSGLTPCLLEPIVKDIYLEIERLKVQELEQDKKKFADEQSSPAQEEEK